MLYNKIDTNLINAYCVFLYIEFDLRFVTVTVGDELLGICEQNVL